jgi:hypothetical protein
VPYISVFLKSYPSPSPSAPHPTPSSRSDAAHHNDPLLYHRPPPSFLHTPPQMRRPQPTSNTPRLPLLLQCSPVSPPSSPPMDELGTAVAGSGRDPAARRAESKTCRPSNRSPSKKTESIPWAGEQVHAGDLAFVHLSSGLGQDRRREPRRRGRSWLSTMSVGPHSSNPTGSKIEHVR